MRLRRTPPASASMRWPVRGRVISGYGRRGKDGIDIAVPTGTPVKAAENGVVIYAGDGLKEFGNTVLVRHENGLVTVYGHASQLEGAARPEGQARPRDRAVGHERQRPTRRSCTSRCARTPPRSIRRPISNKDHRILMQTARSRSGVGRSVAPRPIRAACPTGPQSFSGLPSRPARSWMNCQATRPERLPRVVAHSSASARSVSGSMVEAVIADIAVDHVQIFVLRTFVEAEPQAEAVGQRDLFLDRLGRVDRGRPLIVDHVARQQMPAVRRGVEDDIGRTALDAAFERGLERFVGRVVVVEGQVVAKQDEAVGRCLQDRHQLRQRVDVLAVDLDQLERAGPVAPWR